MLTGCAERSAPAASDTILRRGNGGEPGTLDPQLADDSASLAILADLYEGLTRETAHDGLEGGAAAEWTVTANGRALSFRLREGLRWSNGDGLTAEHFAAGLRHALDPATAAPNAGWLAAIERIETPAPGRLELHLSRADPALAAILALPVAAPRHPLLSDDAAKRPVNGAYRLLEWKPHRHVKLARNEHYRDAAHVSIARVTYVPVEDLDMELRSYRGDLIDLTSEVPNARLDWVRANLPGELHVSPLLATYGYALNFTRLAHGTRAAPRDVAALSRALSLAVDRERLVSRITGAGEQPAYGWVPDGFPFQQPARYAWADMAATARREEARRTLASWSAGAPPPRTLTLCTDASENHRRTALAVADMWREALGIELRLREMEWKVFLAMRRAPQECDLVRLGWSADYLDAAGFLEIFVSHHPQNTLGYSSPGFDSLYRAADETVDPRQRAQGLALAESRLLEEGAVIPLFFRVSKRLVKPRVRGDFGDPLGRLPTRNLLLRSSSGRS